MSGAGDRLISVFAAQGTKVPFQPASEEQIAEAASVAPLPEPLPTLWRNVDLARFGKLEMFQMADFIEVNEVRDSFDDLAEGVFVASDLADGWFFVDPTGFMGMGAGTVFWVERGRLIADDCVPAGRSLIDLIEAAAAGETPWKAPMLGDRAVDRLIARLRKSDSVETRAPLDPRLLTAPGQPPLPLRLGRMLEASNGFLLYRSEREFKGLAAIEPVADTGEADLPGALWIGRGPQGRLYASTTDAGWRGLPADRLIAVAHGQRADDAPVLGRTADIWNRWISEDEAA